MWKSRAGEIFIWKFRWIYCLILIVFDVLNLRNIIWLESERNGFDCEDFIVSKWLEFEAFNCLQNYRDCWPFLSDPCIWNSRYLRVIWVTRYRFCVMVGIVCKANFMHDPYLLCLQSQNSELCEDYRSLSVVKSSRPTIALSNYP